ncbi:hypothetical protein [Candidatus Neomicrothrix sp.]|uniref:hypothetical protein n=1 Tax=Candidatus Neomicrothrix sp. TaxID=2719034 RepID=UPI001B54FCBA|nr:hypothetical protein [Candidatus Microthrix sp.]MBP6136723.1 hypothetical protein [Candidatus Microthrix sp.]
MTVEFRLGHRDHLVVEDALSAGLPGTSGIVLDLKAGARQTAAAAAAKRVGLDVLWDPATWRLATQGFVAEHCDYATGAALGVEALILDKLAQRRLVHQVCQAHSPAVTRFIPPYVQITERQHAILNRDMACMTQSVARVAVRPVVILNSQAQISLVDDIAADYAAAGLDYIELRVSPLGGEQVGPQKIHDVRAMLRTFRRRGVKVVLGMSGSIGHTLTALGETDGYSVGVGMLESFDAAARLNRQSKEYDTPSEASSGAQPGVYLEPLGQTMPKKAALKFLGPDAPTRVSFRCTHACCRDTINGPLLDPKKHYLHTRSAEAHLADERRQYGTHVAGERDRLRKVHTKRRAIALGNPHKPAPTRTLISLIAMADETLQAADTA